MTLDDLKNHTTTPVTPISISYGGENGVTLHETPPNGQGLTALIALGILEAMQDQGKVDLNKVEHLSAEWFHPLMCVPLSLSEAEGERSECTRLTSPPCPPLSLARTARPSASPLPTLAPTSPTPSTRACPSTSSSRSRTSPSAQSCSTRSARRPSSTRGRRSRRPTRSCSRSWTSTGASSSRSVAVARAEH